MASWWRDVAQQLGITGSGSWKRRIAEALQATEGDGPWTKHIAEKGIATVPADGTIVTDGQSAGIKKADGTDFAPAVSGTLSVSNDTLNGVAVPANSAVLTDQQASVTVNQYDDTADFAANVTVAGSVPSFKLANGTTRIAVSEETITVTAGGQSTSATVKVEQGAWLEFPITSPTASLVTNTQAVDVNYGASTVNATFSVAANVASVDLPGVNSVIANGVGQQVPVTGTYTDTITPTIANGVVTGYVLS